MREIRASFSSASARTTAAASLLASSAWSMRAPPFSAAETAPSQYIRRRYRANRRWQQLASEAPVILSAEARAIEHRIRPVPRRRPNAHGDLVLVLGVICFDKFDALGEGGWNQQSEKKELHLWGPISVINSFTAASSCESLPV